MGNPIDGETHIHIAKNRSGQTDTVKVRFIKEYQKFEDIEEDSFGGFLGTGGKGGGFTGGGGNTGFFNTSGSTQFNLGDNPQAGLRHRDLSEFGGSKMLIPGGFQTLPSKANNFNFEEDEDITPPFKKPNQQEPEEDTPF